ncbi:hypothetical protein M405DRAFT_867984 [Rhizopogon salebrosus TDB-379]|nr:hypothetical protein M405DRAFT_867984 [Rhizopogon salebrosus TDB-379]
MPLKCTWRRTHSSLPRNAPWDESAIYIFTSATFVESLRAQDTNWNTDKYFEYESIYGIEGVVSLVPSPMRNVPSTNFTTQRNTLLRVKYKLSAASVRESKFLPNNSS